MPLPSGLRRASSNATFSRRAADSELNSEAEIDSSLILLCGGCQEKALFFFFILDLDQSWPRLNLTLESPRQSTFTRKNPRNSNDHGELMSASFHFLNVGDGDCNIIHHASGRITVNDVSCARSADDGREDPTSGFRQKDHPDNPIRFLEAIGAKSIFRFVLSHPDMDHMDGLADLARAFPIGNFWDIEHQKELTEFSRFREEDWRFYQQVRRGRVDGTKVIKPRAGAEQAFWAWDEAKNRAGGDGLYVLAPDPALRMAGQQTDDLNDASIVLLWVAYGRKFLLSGDSHDDTWTYITRRDHPYAELIRDIDVLVAPHHGRDSDRDFEFLDALNPKVVLIGNAPSIHIAYEQYADSVKLTNNTAGTVSFYISDAGRISVYVSNEAFARQCKPDTRRGPTGFGWLICNF